MSKMFWIDLEMTGLDDEKDHILEVGAVVTDLNFNTLESLHRIIYQPQSVLESMNDWCKKTHGESGLTALVPSGQSLAIVDAELEAMILRHFKVDERVVLCGNSVGNDKRFIDRQMPKLAARLHYRLVDVSSFKEVFRNKYGITVKKGEGHRALDDIQESISELKTYLSYVKI